MRSTPRHRQRQQSLTSSTSTQRMGGVSRKKTHPAYQLYLQSLAPSGRRSMGYALQNAVAQLGWKQAPEHYPWQELCYHDVQRVRSSLLSKNYAISSINVTLCGLRGIARTAFNLELLDADKLMRILAVKAVKGRVLPKKRSLSKTEIRTLLRSCDRDPRKVHGIRNKALLLLGCTAGLRCSELLALRIEHFDADTGAIRVLQAKGMRQREVYLCSRTVTAVKRWIRALDFGQEGVLLRAIRQNGDVKPKGLSVQGLRDALNDLQKRSGTAPFSPHDMRRTFISQLLENGVDLNTVRQLAGHTSITTTVMYDCRNDAALRHASRQIGI